jgi:hypothetical protein
MVSLIFLVGDQSNFLRRLLMVSSGSAKGLGKSGQSRLGARGESLPGLHEMKHASEPGHSVRIWCDPFAPLIVSPYLFQKQ